MSWCLRERYNSFMSEQRNILSDTAKAVIETTESITTTVDQTEEKIEKVVAPVRKHVLKRFPVIFLLLVTLGVTATITGLERLLLQFGFLQNNPLVVLIIGIGLLALTGTLYKKLG